MRAYIPPASLDKTNNFQNSRFRRGPVVGVGLEFKFWKMNVAPEIRYSRIDNPNTDQATILVGFTF
ncbi:MAG: porin family protein [Bryobacterales bacterium]|nr:porin family protein [Bryobacterales bacterium]